MTCRTHCLIGTQAATWFRRCPQRKLRRVLVGNLPVERLDAAHQTLAQERGVPRPLDWRLPLVVTVCRVGIVFLAGGWHSRAGSRAPETTAAVTVELLHHSAPLREIRCYCLRRNGLAIEFAELRRRPRRDSHGTCRLSVVYSHFPGQ